MPSIASPVMSIVMLPKRQDRPVLQPMEGTDCDFVFVCSCFSCICKLQMHALVPNFHQSQRTPFQMTCAMQLPYVRLAHPMAHAVTVRVIIFSQHIGAHCTPSHQTGCFFCDPADASSCFMTCSMIPLISQLQPQQLI